MRHTDEERLSGYYVGWNGNVNRNCGEASKTLPLLALMTLIYADQIGMTEHGGRGSDLYTSEWQKEFPIPSSASVDRWQFA